MATPKERLLDMVREDAVLESKIIAEGLKDALDECIREKLVARWPTRAAPGEPDTEIVSMQGPSRIVNMTEQDAGKGFMIVGAGPKKTTGL